MQPQNFESRTGLEQLPVEPTPNGERIPVLPPVEQGIEKGAERHEQAAEAQAAAADFAAPAVPVIPVVDPAAQGAITSAQPVDDNPAVAGDEDVIEKEWVDKAKKIILETKDDPYTRSTRVNELQKDYLKKRYGKELGAST